MKLKYQDKEIELIYSFRSNIFFEQIQGKNIDFTHFTGTDLMTLFYCVFIASLQKAKLPIIKIQDFMDVIDDNGGNQCLIDFSNWYVGVVSAEYEAIGSMDNKEVKQDVDASKKKTD